MFFVKLCKKHHTSTVENVDWSESNESVVNCHSDCSLCVHMCNTVSSGKAYYHVLTLLTQHHCHFCNFSLTWNRLLIFKCPIIYSSLWTFFSPFSTYFPVRVKALATVGYGYDKNDFLQMTCDIMIMRWFRTCGVYFKINICFSLYFTEDIMC